MTGSSISSVVCATTLTLASWGAAGVRASAAESSQGLADSRDRAVATVLIFTAVDCPISDRYAPELTRLAASFGDRVRFALVYPNVGDSDAAIDAHARAFGYAIPHRRDADGRLVDQTGVSVTPEVAVLDAAGQLAYRGRIDDRYTDFGVDRPTPSRRDLAVALEELVAGRPVSVSHTQAVGCAIVRRP